MPFQEPPRPPATPGEPLKCTLCEGRAWKGPGCPQCPLYQQQHYAEGIGSENADYFCIAESPHITNVSSNTLLHEAWNNDIEKVIRNAFIQHKNKHPHLRNLDGRYTYAIRCMHERPVKKMLRSCRTFFFHDLATNHKKDVEPIMIFALGPAVLQAFDIKVGKYSEVQGQFIETQVRGKKAVIFPSLSKRQLIAKTGFYEILLRHIDMFMEAVHRRNQGAVIETKVPLEELTKHYVFPKTADEVRRLVETIVNYSDPGKDPNNHVISLDTETNTLYPHRSKLKILSLVVAWDTGKAASIPLEHPETPWSLEEVYPFISELLNSQKPKVFHNAKFDLKVLARKGWTVRRFLWDTLLGEHLLSEDKKGFYGLKPLTKLILPRYAGYEDQLHEALKKEESDNLLQQLKTEEADKSKKKEEKVKLSKAERTLAKDTGFIGIALDKLNVYGAIDADVTRQLYLNQRERMDEEEQDLAKKRKKIGTNRYFRDLVKPMTNAINPLKNLMITRSIPVSRVLSDMELNGVPIDREYIEDLAIEMDRSVLRSKVALHAMILPNSISGGVFNPNSALQLRKILYSTGFRHPETGKLICYKGIVKPPETKTGLISTNAQFLRSLKTQYDCPFSKVLLEYRAIMKARNTFVENIRVLSREDGRMHTTFHINGTSTGRLSSSNENMQNIPLAIGTHNIKKIFVPSDRENMVIVNADAKAAEVRLYAAYSGDIALIKALQEGMDPHSFFSGMVYKPETILAGVPRELHDSMLSLIGIDNKYAWSYEDFESISKFVGTKEHPGPDPAYGKRLEKLRKNMKRVVFGILYGASRHKISDIVGIPPDQAQAIIDVLFRMFPTIPEYIKRTQEQLRFMGMVETFTGRRRRLNPEGLPPKLAAKAQRQAVNFKIQSNSSDIVLDVLCDVDRPIRELGGRLLITVHDSIVFELPKKYVYQMPDFIEEYGVKRTAQKYPWLPVPFKWDVTVGPSYGEQMSVKDFLAEYNVITSARFNPDDYIEHEIKQDFEELAS